MRYRVLIHDIENLKPYHFSFAVWATRDDGNVLRLNFCDEKVEVYSIEGHSIDEPLANQNWRDLR